MRPYERALNMANTMMHETKFPQVDDRGEELHDAIATPKFDLRVGDYVYIWKTGNHGERHKIIYEVTNICEKFFQCKRLHTHTPESFTKIDYFLGDVKKYN